MFLINYASITTRKNQSISVNTYPKVSAIYKLLNDEEICYVNSTLYSTIVNRSCKDLAVSAEKINMTTGNLLIGGVVSLAIDVCIRAGYDYPSSITVPLY